MRQSITSLRGQISSQLSGQQEVKNVQNDQRHSKVLASEFWDSEGILFIDYLEKGRTINSEYYIALLMCLKEEIVKKGHKWRKKCSFTKTMHCVTNQSQQWQNYMNCTLNCFCTLIILQILPPATTGCLQTSKECFSERELTPIKWYRKLRHILRPKTNRSTKKASNC